MGIIYNRFVATMALLLCNDVTASNINKDSEAPCQDFTSSLRRRDLHSDDNSRSSGCGLLRGVVSTDPKSYDNVVMPQDQTSINRPKEEDQQQTFFQFTIADKSDPINDKKPSLRKSSAQMRNESESKEVNEKARVAIYWPHNNRYFEAVVLQVQVTRFLVRYVDDDREEWVDSTMDQLRVISSTGDSIKWSQIRMSELLTMSSVIDDTDASANS